MKQKQKAPAPVPVRLKPAPGEACCYPFPNHRKLLPADGANVQYSKHPRYWSKQIRRGVVVPCEPPKKTKTKRPAKGEEG